jgi:hypothetical protein
MEESDRRAESGDEVHEGTAVYSEVRTLEAIKQDFKSGLTPARDPYYSGFKDADTFLGRYRERLAKTKADTLNYLKCYEYGCFQALLLQRLFPGWQEAFASGPAFQGDLALSLALVCFLRPFSRHGGRDTAGNGPTSRIRSELPEKTPRIQTRPQEPRGENVNRR